MKEEFSEVEEPIPEGTVGSSTMPHKRNPKLAQDIRAATAEVRALVPLALEAMLTEHEADRTNMNVMRRALEGACIETGDVLQRLLILVKGLRVFPDRMRSNLDLSGGLIMSEPIMLELGKKMGRQRAHDVVYEESQAAAIGKVAFRDLLAVNQTVRKFLSDSEIDEVLDPLRYIGLSTHIAVEQARFARQDADEIRTIDGVAAARIINAEADWV